MNNIFAYILVMAGVTYLIRVLPLVLFRKEIKSKLVKSFLYYVPYAALASMTFPAILYATDSMIAAALAFAVALVLSFRGKNMVTVALVACAVVFVVERVII